MVFLPIILGNIHQDIPQDGKQHLAGKTKLQHLVGANMFAALHGMDAFILHPGRMPLAETPFLEDIRHTDYCPHTDTGRLYQRVGTADGEQLGDVSRPAGTNLRRCNHQSESYFLVHHFVIVSYPQLVAQLSLLHPFPSNQT